MQPLISIIIPIYNTAELLERCVCSVVAQSYGNIEVILVDDGSTDASLETCKRLQMSDKRIKIVEQKNSGASAARNRGLEIAKGEYIMFVDSDDYIDSNMVESLYSCVKEQQTDIVISDIPGDNANYNSSKKINNTECLKNILSGIWWGPVGKLFNRKAIGETRFPSHTISEDYVFMVHNVHKAKSIYYKNSCYYHRTYRENSLSTLNICKRKFDELYNVEAVNNFIAEHYPQMQKLSENNLAGTLIKLLFAIYETKSESIYTKEHREILSTIRKKYFKFLRNEKIMLKQRLILALCFSKATSKLIYNLYKRKA